MNASGSWSLASGSGEGTGSGWTHGVYTGSGGYAYATGGVSVVGLWNEWGGDHAVTSSHYDYGVRSGG